MKRSIWWAVNILAFLLGFLIGLGYFDTQRDEQGNTVIGQPKP